MQDNQQFFIGLNRAMVSLGPLSKKATCPHKCAFCYTQDGFSNYASLPIEQIIDFLKANFGKYEIIYISGDTDSFAPPRKQKGLELLDEISKEFDIDILFTTRTVFNEDDLKKLETISKRQKNKGKLLFGCISIPRYHSCGYIEPKPIPTPEERLKTLKALKNIGLVTVLAMRPFLPVVNKEDYFDLVKDSHEFTDIILGENFYFVRGGKIESRLFIDGISKEIEQSLSPCKMDFDNNDGKWVEWRSEKLEDEISNLCKEFNIIFNMRSQKAIDLYKAKINADPI